MIKQGTTIRVARPTDNLNSISEMYQKGLGFRILAKFEDHEGFDGIVLGNSGDSYHIEFTHHRGTTVGKAPTQDNLLVFYIEDPERWKDACNQAESAGFKKVASYNPYWDLVGLTYEDVDGYRVVFQNGPWNV